MSLAVFDWEEAGHGVLPGAATIGVFDGVHRGHRELIRRVVEKGPNPTVISFKETPKSFLAPESYDGDIFSREQKLEVFESLGVRQVVLIDFSVNFSRMNGLGFIEVLEKRLNIVFLAVGSNFRCGYKQDTGAESIKTMNERGGIPTEIVPPVLETGLPVSSSRIRTAISQGDVAAAAALLGRNLELDLRGVRPQPGERDGVKGSFFNTRERLHRVLPAPGQYRALVKTTGGGCEETVVEVCVIVNNEGVFIPYAGGAVSPLEGAGTVRVIFI
jgi:riboflavin kinase/FMN adenylyltransferase